MAKNDNAAHELAVARFHAAVSRLGLVLDILDAQAQSSGKKIKVHAETFKALYRHHENLRRVADNALKEVTNAHPEFSGA